MLRSKLLLGGIFFLILSIAPAALAGDAYLDDVTAAATDLSQGSYDMAVNEASAALVHRSDDPLAHITLATALLHTRQLDLAEKEFAAANTGGSQPFALYGLGLCALVKGNAAAALDYFRKIAPGSLVDAAPAAAYISSLTGSAVPSDSTDGILRQAAAQSLLAKKSYAEARAAISSVLQNRKELVEPLGTVATFDPQKPAALTAPPLTKKFKLPAMPKDDQQKVSGILTLKADLPRTSGIAYVLFYIDGRAVGIVNHPPYECQYDTRKLSNAQHTVKIEGRDINASIISDRSVQIFVFNADSVERAPVAAADSAPIEEKLWSSLQLKPSLKVAYYSLMECARGESDRAAELAAAEAVVAIDPAYRDARTRLQKLYAPASPYQEVWKVKAAEKIAAITFDDGPSTRTPQLLDVLKEKGVKATFFAVGSMAEANPEILKRMADEGHEIESHTYSHMNLSYIPDSVIERELIRNQSVIRSIIGRAPSYFRAPGGHHNGSLAKIAASYGLSQVMWTVNCGSSEGKKPETMVNQVRRQVTPGSVILMHNVETITLMALPDVIDMLRAKGYKLVTLSELLKAGPVAKSAKKPTAPGKQANSAKARPHRAA